MMCLTHNNLKEKPFQINPDPKFIWLGENHRKALTVLENAVFDNNHYILITGDVGTGKTTLINAFLEHLGEKTVVANITFPILEKLDFLSLVANEFNINIKFGYNVDFLIHFRRFLNNCYSKNKNALLIIDEAHRLDQELLVQIQFLSNIGRHYAEHLKIIFVGQDEFIDILSEEENQDLSRKITIKHRIEPLGKAQVAEYIVHRLRVAGHEGNIFGEDAIAEIFSSSKGYPAVINNICEHALLARCVHNVKTINAEIIKECIDKLGIPTESIDDDIKEQEALEKINEVDRETAIKSSGTKLKSIFLFSLLIIVFSLFYYHGKFEQGIETMIKNTGKGQRSQPKLPSINMQQIRDANQTINPVVQNLQKSHEAIIKNQKIDSNVAWLPHAVNPMAEKKQADHKTVPLPHVEKTKLNIAQDRILPGRYTVYLHYSSEKNKDLMEGLAIFLKNKGFEVAGIERFNYKNRDIRYFHNEDKSGALLLKKHLTQFITPYTYSKNTNIRIFNLSHKYPNAQKGALELWVTF